MACRSGSFRTTVIGHLFAPTSRIAMDRWADLSRVFGAGFEEAHYFAADFYACFRESFQDALLEDADGFGFHGRFQGAGGQGYVVAHLRRRGDADVGVRVVLEVFEYLFRALEALFKAGVDVECYWLGDESRHGAPYLVSD